LDNLGWLGAAGLVKPLSLGNNLAISIDKINNG